MPSGSRARISAAGAARRGGRRRTCRGSAAARPGPQAPPRLEHDLGVGARREPHALRLELAPQLAVVVELAVVDEGQAVLDERLVGRRGQVDDGQPPVGQLTTAVSGVDQLADAARVRPAVGEAVDHRVDDDACRPTAGSCPATPHMVRPPSRPRRRATRPNGSARPHRRASRLGGQLVVDRRRSPPPGGSRPAPSRRARGPTRPSRPAARVVDELDDRVGVRVDVVRLARRPRRPAADTRVSREVEGDDRQPEGHVLHGLVHRGDVVERVLRVGRQPDVRGREHVGDVLVRHPAGELDVVLADRARRAARRGRRRQSPRAHEA